MDNKLTTSPPLNRPSQNNSSCYLDTNGSTHSHLCPYFWHNSIQLYSATGVCERVCLSFWCLCVPPSRSDAIRCMPNLFHFFFGCVCGLSGLCQELCHTPFIKILFYFSIFCVFFGVHLFSMTFPLCDIPACMHRHIHPSNTLFCHSFSFTCIHFFLCICMRDNRKQ